MNYEITLVNPKTSEHKKIIVALSPEQAADARAAACLQSFIQGIAHPEIPDGFMPLSNGVRAVTLQ
jgi:hypothetical protein